MTEIARNLVGTCGFRLMPTDELATAESSAAVTALGPDGFALSYSWQHAADGEQRGSILAGAPQEDGTVEVSWFDTFHHHPALMRLTGQRHPAGDAPDEHRVDVAGEWAPGWGWTISLTVSDRGVEMTMCNVIPETEDRMGEAGPYVVMAGEWSQSR